MRSKKAVANTIVQLVLEIVTIVSGFVLPRLIIQTFGSDENGLVVSITQFFGYLTLLQSGIGGVAKAALYKPLAERNTQRISELVKAISSFFRKIGYISIAYLLVLIVVFPTIIYPNGNAFDTAILVFIIWLGIFSQYCFGITYQYLLQADQRYYIYSITQIGVVVINTIVSVLLIRAGYSLVIVKLLGSIVFIIRPVLLSLFCKKTYSLLLTNDVKPANELLKQRWDGFGHTIAYFIHSKTDVFVLTLFSTFVNVSIYSVYASVATGLSLLLNTIATSVQSAFGNMIARNEKETLGRNFRAYVCLNNVMVMILFSTAIITIIPFMRLYTLNFKKAEGYINGLFAFLLLLAESSYCIRMPYQTIILAAGHYKQTRNGAFIEAALNIGISLLLVHKFGIIGVTIGTLCAMIFRTIQYIAYISNIIENEKLSAFIVGICVDFCFLSVAYCISQIVEKMDIVHQISNYFQWGIFSVIVFGIMAVFALLITFIIERNSVGEVLLIVRRSMKRKR